MPTFQLYLGLGIDHIIDLEGYDHILFITALCAVYAMKQWRSILILVTAFTIGHSTTLALATLNIINISPNLIELLIPITIFITGLWNVLQSTDSVSVLAHRFKYGTALFFGLIHGTGFSIYLRSLLGKEDSIVLPLFSFNLGLEIGQVIIVLIVLLISFVLVNILHVKRREWNLIFSGAAMGVSLILIIERFPG
ncbi:MAG: HupE / UreJ protein [Bacteroides sp. SM23_62_1]|nr:MAG: HupE / UreJ protein [Bacteroides sp. SM23_62_1]